MHDILCPKPNQMCDISKLGGQQKLPGPFLRPNAGRVLFARLILPLELVSHTPQKLGKRGAKV